MEQLGNEVWKPVVGYEGLYEVSSLGNMKSVMHSYINKGRINIKKSKLKSLSHNQKGYLITGLYKNIHITVKLHRIVAISFIPNPENKPQVNHKNGIRDDNRVENLEWCTNKENQIHSFSVLKRKNPPLSESRFKKLIEGSIRAQSIPVIQYDMDNNYLFEYSSITNAARSFGVHNSGIVNCLKGRSKNCMGFKWKYKYPTNE